MTRSLHIPATQGAARALPLRGLLLLSRLWACLPARPLRGDTAPDTL